MSKRIKLHKLKKEYDRHFKATEFCIQKQQKLVNDLDILTETGKAKYWKYDRRASIHRKAYEKTLHKIDQLAHSI